MSAEQPSLTAWPSPTPHCLLCKGGLRALGRRVSIRWHPRRRRGWRECGLQGAVSRSGHGDAMAPAGL